MRSLITTVISVFLFLQASTQPVFRTVVPARAVIAGESFQVQYVLEDGNRGALVTTPDFKNFKKVAGPYAYSGVLVTGKAVYNTVYTLTALNPGRYIIPGASVSIDGKQMRSNDEVLQVISKEEAVKRSKAEAGSVNTAYYLAPGEKPEDKVKANLFLKVSVNKHVCYTGEPVVAEFKLYSRLESKSDITHNPGFYGFTVYDMVSLSDQQQSTELVNGKLFTVHTIRKLQLYPQQSGRLTIDPMQIKHTVEFSTTVTSKPTEQQIAEGVLTQNRYDNPGEEGKVVIEVTSSTEPLSVEVKPLPAAGKPAGYNGATGSFSLSTALSNDKLAKQEEGSLKVTVSGKGNFTQLTFPVIAWPEGVEGFEPVISDSLDKATSPLSGSRTYSFPFIATRSGTYSIPAVTFSFFDPGKSRYATLTASPITVTISGETKTSGTAVPVIKKDKNSSSSGLIIYGVMLLVVSGVIFIALRKRAVPVKKEAVPEPVSKQIAVAAHLQKARSLADEKQVLFSEALRQSVWNSCAEALHLSGSLVNKQQLKNSLEAHRVPEGTISGILDILAQCDAALFAGVTLPETPAQLLERTEGLLEQVRSALL